MTRLPPLGGWDPSLPRPVGTENLPFVRRMGCSLPPTRTVRVAPPGTCAVPVTIGPLTRRESLILAFSVAVPVGRTLQALLRKSTSFTAPDWRLTLPPRLPITP